MVRCFLIPMTDPPYSRVNPQRPKYVDQFENSRTNSPLLDKGYFLSVVSARVADLNWLQNQDGVIDLPNIDNDRIRDLPPARRQKNHQIEALVEIAEDEGETVGNYINRVACASGNNWEKSKVYVREVGEPNGAGSSRKR